MNSPRILVVEDEPSIAENIAYALAAEGFGTVWTPTGGEADARFDAEPFDLVVLDVGLPDTNGFEFCKRLRARSRVPILFVTARSSEIDRVVGLEIGGDDYVVKPFSPRELAARAKAILRRARDAAPTPGPPDPRPAADLVVDPERKAASFRGAPLDLTRYEFRLLQALDRRPGKVFSRDELMELAWEEPDASTDRTVDAHVKTLRAKLRAAGAGDDVIRTHRGMGYSIRERQ